MITVDEITPYLLTPKKKKCGAEQIKYAEGTVRTENWNKREFTLVYEQNGEKPYLILDLGRSSPGGYPVFTVKSHKCQPILRISYSDWYPYLLNKDHRDTGDFLRGCCKYLGVELPVLPANPNRYELYTVNRTGKYIYPLIQGQQRFVLLTLDTPGEVEIEDFHIYYTSDMGAYEGGFLSSHSGLNQLWYSGTYTVQIASIDNSQSWEVIEDTLLLRALTKGNPAGIYSKGCEWTDYSFRFNCQIAVNPDCRSGIGWMVRAQNSDNGYAFQLSLDGILKWFVRKDSYDTQIGEKRLSCELTDNKPYMVTTKLKGEQISVYLDEVLILEWNDSVYSKGTVGFIQTTEKWAAVSALEVIGEDAVLLKDDFKNGLNSDYVFTRSLPFLSDGAKRDRLPWIGDLDWAGRNIYYAFADLKYMWGSLLMFAKHQTPEGYIWGACYPENEKAPRIGEYGYYESDIFSAWFVPTLWDYLLFTGKTGQVQTLYEPMVKDLEYLWSWVEGNGLFFQRYATSKGLWDHELNDIGHFSYNNIIVYDALLKGSYIADALGDEDLAEKLRFRSSVLKESIMKYLWQDGKGCFPKGLQNEEFCHMANCLALAVGILSPKQAKQAIDRLLKWFPENLVYDKIVSLFIRGCFNYGYDEIAYRTLTGKTGLSYEGDTPVYVDWLNSIADENGPATTTECMLYPPASETEGKQWMDRSHPDTAVAHLLSGYLLGVEPIACGYRSFKVEPHCCELTYAKGIIPSPYGKIQVEWKIENKMFSMNIIHPKETAPVISTQYVCMPVKEITVNGSNLRVTAQV